MLPPQALSQRSLSSASSIVLRASASSVLRSTAAHAQVRGFWGWRRPRDYDSRSDPLFHRFCRYRTLKTRAKLLEKLRRRGRWEWDINQRPFFSPRSIRLASHFPRPKPRHHEDGKQSKDGKDAAEDDGLELSQREKQWKDQMEAMRRRIEQDPYEAIFGKRFEPFWSPLVPSWMREEMGLSRWPKQPSNIPPSTPADKSTLKQTSPTPNKPPEKPVRAGSPARNEQQPKRDGESETEGPNGQLTTYSYSSKKSVNDADPDGPNGQLTNYSYSSSTSWDSLTQRTRREEWDSLTGQTRRYEYDPISNRMIQIEASEGQNETQQVENPAVPTSAEAKLPESQSNVASSSAGSSGSNVVEMPVKTSNTIRKAIPVPTRNTLPANVDRKTSVYFPSLLNTAVMSSPAKPAALAKIPERDLEKLTADEIRASVGKTKQDRGAADRVQGTLSQARAYRNGKPDPSRSEWDQAETQIMLDHELDALMRKKQKLLDHEHDNLHAERLKNELKKLDERIGEVAKQLRHPILDTKTHASGPHPLNSFAEMRKQLMSKYSAQPKLEPALDRALKSEAETKVSKDTAAASLQSSLERMSSKELPLPIEPDDSAAHESTGDAVDYKAAHVPEAWERQADILQADRVRRTRGAAATSTRNEQSDQPLPVVKQRWIDVMNSRKAAYDAQQAHERAVIEARDAEKNARLEKANAMLEAEVKEQKFLMQSYENRYAHKIQSLKQELSTAYRQSSADSEVHVNRIRNLEQELEQAQKAAGDSSAVARFQSERERFQKKISDLKVELDTAYRQSSANAEMQVERIQRLEKELVKAQMNGSVNSQREKERYMKKVKALREDLDIAFKQSAVQSEKHVERIRELENELESIRNQGTKVSVGAEAVRTEGDISTDAAKYAKDSSRWYKQPMHPGGTAGKPTAAEMEKAAQKHRDQALVQEVRAIYESRYGTIDINHQQSQSHSEQGMQNGPQVTEVETDVDLGKALAEYEKEQSYQYQKDDLEAEIAAQEREAHEAQAIPTEPVGRNNIAAQEITTSAIRSSIEWEEPPLYKVLAYDPGNDLLSVATTSSNFSGKEAPISIPEALSQLYQPARFVPHFARLQSEGYQVIYGTKDLLLFKKVRSTPTNTAKMGRAPALEDHGLVGINPIDGTTHFVEPDTGPLAFATGPVGDKRKPPEGEPQPLSPVSASEPLSHTEAESPSTTLTSPHENYSQPADEAPEMSAENPTPRIKREERVFSGGRLKQKRDKRRHHHEPTPQQVKGWHKKWRCYRRRMRWAVGVGLGAAVVAYGVGAAAERKDVSQKERWQQILEGKRARWE